MKLFIVVAAAAIAGCTTATPIARSETGTTIRYDPALYSSEQIQAKADGICGAYGRRAVLTGVENDNVIGLGFDHATFDCVPN